jgi:endonuclease/exonuclease/phosphatase family metal-dependent hydrolase
MRLWLGAVVVAALAAGPARGVSSLSVMTFNVWTGEATPSGRNKLAEIIRTSGADVVGLQEMENNAGMSIASALGFQYSRQSASDIQVISRYPIVGQSASSLGVQIELSAGQQIWLFNAHLAPYPYQPYDLRDGILPKNEAAVIAAANAARGGQVTAYLNDMTAALSSGQPVFFTGDFNEPSHLDWTEAAAAATPRSYDLKVQYPASNRIVDAGMTDSLRAVRPDPVTDPAYTWTPGYPPPTLASNEVHDRIDIVYHKGAGVRATSARTVSFPDNSPSTDLAIPGYNADHRAVVVTYALPASLVAGDLNFDGLLDAADWRLVRDNQLADLSGKSADQTYELGDLNGDLRNDYTDFALFKRYFDETNGAGAFVAMLAVVPEPASETLLGLVLLGCLRRRRCQAS